MAVTFEYTTQQFPLMKMFKSALPSVLFFKFRQVISNNKQLSFAICFVFLLFFSIEMLTPFHSDDFSYGQFNGLTKHLNHYLRWSGRIIADFSSSTILSFPHLVVSLILATFSTSLCWLITAIPEKISHGKLSTWKFLLISSCYWVFNPNLGQINFWVVGASNYLITTFFVALVIYLTFVWKVSAPLWAVPVLAIVALFAGCSNENTSIALIYFILAITAYERYKEIYFSKKLRFLILCCICLGAAFLILAPGNFVRLNHPHFASWRAMSLFQQITTHLHRSKQYFDLFWPILILLGLCSLVLRKFIGYEDIKKRMVGAGISITASLLALVVMFKSPAMPLRSFAGMFFFLLLAVSFVVDGRLFNLFLTRTFKVLTICLTALLFLSYSLMLINYKDTKVQEGLRNAHINYEKLLHGQSASPTIPGYFFPNLLRNGEKFDMYHSPSQASWFGVKSIRMQKVNFDYSAIRNGKEIMVLNNSSSKNIKAYVKTGIGRNPKTTLIIECSRRPESSSIVVKAYRNRDKNPLIFTLSKPIELMGKTYFGITGDIKNSGEIKSVEVKDATQ